MKTCRALIGFVIEVKIFRTALFIFVIKMEFSFKNVLLHSFGERKMYKGGGGSAKIFEINLLRTWCVYIESRISRKMPHQAHLFLAFA